MHILNTVRAREMVRSEDTVNIDTFTSDIIDGRTLHMVYTDLGLMAELDAPVAKKHSDVLGQMLGDGKE